MSALNVKYLNTTKGDSRTTLVFAHGNSQNLHFWDYQMESPLFGTFNRMAFDLPGHGKSVKMDDYRVKNVIPVISDTLQNMGSIIIIGHSLGGHLILQSLSSIDNCIGLVLIGTPPLKKPLNMLEAFAPDERMGLLFKEELSEKEREIMIEFIGCKNNRPLAQDALEHTDTKFRSHMANSVASGGLVDELEVLKNIDFPVALIVGETDQLINKSYLNSVHFPALWKEQVQYIPKAGHTPQLENSEEFNKLLSDFIYGIQ
ncbi:alpha/beta fold hydrolase [Ulvibacterium sp.]|uniref:alpha/beta fold hydrolase n=1 Tax=Ulvibacterium sp. TaxID=2665914 RepID=UPI003BA92183